MCVCVCVCVCVTIICNRACMRTGRERQLIVFNDVTECSTSFQDSHKLDESRRTPDLLFFNISIILAATDNFSPDKRLGQGGFGPVYKVLLLVDDKHL